MTHKPVLTSPEEVLAATGLASTGLVYTSTQVEAMFRKKQSWLRIAWRGGYLPDVEPVRRGGRLLWYAEDVQKIAVQRFQRGLMDADELKCIVRRLVIDTSVYDRNYLVNRVDVHDV